jgi:aspartate/glutamate racemase
LAASRQFVRDVTYHELCHALIRQESRVRYQESVGELADENTESIFLAEGDDRRGRD